jgi:hypothetical protein
MMMTTTTMMMMMGSITKSHPIAKSDSRFRKSLHMNDEGWVNEVSAFTVPTYRHSEINIVASEVKEGTPSPC